MDSEKESNFVSNSGDIQEVAELLVELDEKEKLTDEDKLDLLLSREHARENDHPGIEAFATDIAKHAAFRDFSYLSTFVTEKWPLKIGGGTSAGLYLHLTDTKIEDVPKVSRYDITSYANFLEMDIMDAGLIATSIAGGLGTVALVKYADMEIRGNVDDYLTDVLDEDPEVEERINLLEEKYEIEVHEEPIYRRIIDKIKNKKNSIYLPAIDPTDI